jgi:hypothetical protein
MTALTLPSYAQLSDADEAALTDLYRRGAPANTLRAWERDLAVIAAWKMSSFGRPLDWPEDEKVALRFILDHAQDLTDRPGPAQVVAMALIAIGLRRELTCPAPATLDRRIASWHAFHRMRNLPSPFSAPLVQQARQEARRANARPRVPKSPKPVTRDILEALLATWDDSHRGIRDQATLQVLGAAAEFGRALIRERTKAGLTSARTKGRIGGNPGLRARDPAALRKVRLALQNGYMERLNETAQDWVPHVRRLRPDMDWEDVVRIVNGPLPRERQWTQSGLLRAGNAYVRDGFLPERLGLLL